MYLGRMRDAFFLTQYASQMNVKVNSQNINDFSFALKMAIWDKRIVGRNQTK